MRAWQVARHGEPREVLEASGDAIGKAVVVL
jgi:hypothetical protein